MAKLTNDDKTFLDRVCFRLFSNPLKWRSMLKSGLSHQEVYQVLVNETNKKKAEAESAKENHAQSTVSEELNLHASDNAAVRGSDQ